jgi:hypothetical protein
MRSRIISAAPLHDLVTVIDDGYPARMACWYSPRARLSKPAVFRRKLALAPCSGHESFTATARAAFDRARAL